MNEQEKKEKWSFAQRIEEMSDEELKIRIEKAMNFPIEGKIRPLPYLGEKDLTIEYSYPELCARCPMTGIKDLYKIKIKYVPDKIIPELKSLKLYFWGYENLPISHEHIIAKIFKDFEIIIKPKKLAILLYVAERGEMITTIAIGDEKLLNFTRFFQDENFGR